MPVLYTVVTSWFSTQEQEKKAQIFASKLFKMVHAEAVPDSELSL